MTNNVVIKIEDVDKSFSLLKEGDYRLKSILLNPIKAFNGERETFNALSDVSLEVSKGDFLGVIGRNGSGKSTLLKLIAGIYEPDKGKLTVNGSMVPFLELGVGFNPELTAKENIFLNGTILGMSRKYLEKKLEHILEFAEVKKFANTPVKNFSSGMLLKLAFSIAVQADADIFILDEILAVGDALFQQKSKNVIDDLIEKGKTIVLVSHDLNSIERYCNKVLWLDKGKVRYFGDKDIGINMYNDALFNEEKENLETDGSERRIGSFDVSVSHVEAIFENNNLELTAFIDHKNKVDALNLTFGIYKTSGENILSISTQMDEISVRNDVQEIKLLLEDLNLLPGHYYVNVALFADLETIPYHWQKRMAIFNIKDNVNSKYRGINHFKHKWQTK